jgi:putative YhbY family RNA-binding protein
MPAIQLTPAQRKVHRAEAHHLDPVVMIGSDGLTPAVQKEADNALKAHGLIKIRVLSDDRTQRKKKPWTKTACPVRATSRCCSSANVVVKNPK